MSTPSLTEQLGSFYLGREYNLDTKSLESPLVNYDSKDLVTHGVVLGMTGSGKTGLCLALLEEAAIDDVPAIVIDPKGDIANLMLTFPDFRQEDFEPWVQEGDARRKGMSKEEYAKQQAELWEKGTADWGQSPERLRQFRERTDVNIFTPGSSAGIPVSILSSLEVPPLEVMESGELLGERIESTVTSLLALVGVRAEPMRSPEHVLISAIFQHSWQAGQGLSLEMLIRHLQSPPFDKIGVIDLETFAPSKDRVELALKFNSLLASPSFAQWIEGVPLDIDQMLRSKDGKPRISIFSIAHLSDDERMFFVSLLFNQMLGWMRSQSGTTSLRALLYMDEIYGYLPPTANPPSKKPLMTMLKQARAYGLGCLLATQNPVDLDYKALSNIGTWWLGRLQTERDKARVLDGLEGAAAGDGGKFDRGEMEELLAGLGSRVFLMHNVHEDAPTVFHVRWVMSYLRGPVTRNEIQTLMEPRRQRVVDELGTAVSDAGGSAPGGPAKSTSADRPVLGAGIEEAFVLSAGETEGLSYRPTLLRQASVQYRHTKSGIDQTMQRRLVLPFTDKGLQESELIEWTAKLSSLRESPEKGIGFDSVPGEAISSKSYTAWEKGYIDQLYREDREEILYSPDAKLYSEIGEEEAAFRQRVGLEGRQARDEAVEKIRRKYESKLKTLENRLRTAKSALSREEAQAQSSFWQTVTSVGATIMGALFSRKKVSVTNMRRGASSMNSASRAYQQKQDVARAEEKIEDVENDIKEMEEELKQAVAEIEERFDPQNIELEPLTLKPYKKDIHVESCKLLWLPEDDRGDWAW